MQVPDIWHCDHETTEIRRRIKSNGVSVCCVQCLTCGAGLREVSKSSPDVLKLATINDFDPQLADDWSASRQTSWQTNQHAHQARLDAERTKRDEDWQAWYATYRETEKWQKKRGRVMQRAKGRCEGCGEALATEVHHLTYAHVGDEFLWELAAVCRACHQRTHGRESA